MNHRTLSLLLLLACLFSLACNSSRVPPSKPYSTYQLSPTPDYSLSGAWCALPEKEDFADDTPPSVSPERQDSAKADVFFLHPTTFMGGLAWNANVNDVELNASTDERSVRHQASIFNGVAKVYAPRYRQMAFGGFFTSDTASKIKAIELAYQDVKASFEYYLEHYNQGRPFIIASHSQGSIHAIRILREYVDDQALGERLIAAYVLGWPFPADTFKTLPICNDPTQTGCIMGWCTFKDGYVPDNINTHYKDAVVVNPLNWKADGTPADKSQHDGFLMGNYKKMKTESLSVQAHDGILWSSIPIPLTGFLVKNYHAGDFNLFWLDVRQNAADRVEAYLEQQ
ncbi:MAG: DUF3089 domain-containing protein [Bacteroidia bacterium]